MPSLHAIVTPVDRPDILTPPADAAAVRPQNLFLPEPAPTRVIEVGEITAGIAVPEGRGVRFFSSSRDFDGLDGAVFRSAEQAARAARERFRALARPGSRPGSRQSLRPVAV